MRWRAADGERTRHPDRRRGARSRLADLHPIRVYQRWEAAAALMSVSATVPGDPYLMLQRFPDIWRWRSNPAGIVVLGAARRPRRVAIADDEADVTFAELDRRTNAIAAAWRAAGLGEQSTVGVLARNGRVFMEASLAAAKLGADVVYLNGAFGAHQVAEVVDDEEIDVLCYDDALAEAASMASPTVAVTEAAISRAAEQPDADRLAPPGRVGRVVVLTSGTTGRPRGARRAGSAGAAKTLDAAGILTCIPFAPGEVSVVAAPLFHGLGLFTANLTLMLNGTAVLRSRFDPEQTLQDISDRRRDGPRGGSGDAPADARAARAPARSVRHVEPADRDQRRRAAVRGPGGAVHGSLRRRPLQRLRLQRDRARDRRAAP